MVFVITHCLYVPMCSDFTYGLDFVFDIFYLQMKYYEFHAPEVT